jgi:hypothetical protein
LIQEQHADASSLGQARQAPERRAEYEAIHTTAARPQNPSRVPTRYRAPRLNR